MSDSIKTAIYRILLPVKILIGFFRKVLNSTVDNWLIIF